MSEKKVSVSHKNLTSFYPKGWSRQLLEAMAAVHGQTLSKTVDSIVEGHLKSIPTEQRQMLIERAKLIRSSSKNSY